MTKLIRRYILCHFRSYSTPANGIHSSVRVRFAPSPTGKMHLGGLRMVLYNYIFAKQNNGKFVLRIEDTDQRRCVPGAAEEIESTLKWAHLEPDESPLKGGPYGPYVQTKRLDLYKKKAFELVERGKAYRCFCSPMRLELMRRQQAKSRMPLGYDGKCRHLNESEVQEKIEESQGNFAIRLAANSENTKNVICDDLIFGKIQEKKIHDPIILKSDLYPTYHLANVVDDHAMRITHVLRGSEWLSSIQTHISLYEAFEWTPPQYAHFPLINSSDGTKMSKRNKDSTVESWIEKGYSSLVLLNFLTNIGGGVPKEKQDANEVWTVQEITSSFDFKKVSNHPGGADIIRLNLYSANEIKKIWKEDPPELVRRLRSLFVKEGIDCKFSDEDIVKILEIFVNRIVRLNDLVNFENAFIWAPPKLSWPKDYYLEKDWNLNLIVSSIIDLVQEQGIEDIKAIDLKLKAYVKANNLNYPDFMKLIRKLLTNNHVGLPVYELFSYLGKERLVEYLKSGLNYVSN